MKSPEGWVDYEEEEGLPEDQSEEHDCGDTDDDE